MGKAMNVGGGGGNNKIAVHVKTRALHDKLSPIDPARMLLAGDMMGDGSAVFAGGRYNTNDDNNVTATVDRYELSGVHSELPGLSVARQAMGSATLGDDSIVFAGGEYYQTGTIKCKNVDKYSKDGLRATFPSMATGGNTRGGTLSDGRAVFAGGDTFTSVVATVNCYDKDGVLTQLPDLSLARSFVSTARLGDGRLLCAGGGSENIGNPNTSNVDCYDGDGVRTAFTKLSASKSKMGGAILGDGSVIFAGGHNGFNTIDRFSPDGVRTTSTLLSGSGECLAAPMGDGSVFICARNDNARPIRFDVSGAQTLLAVMFVPSRSTSFAISRMGDGSVLAVGGGSTTTQFIAAAERYSVNKRAVRVPAYMRYRFSEDTKEHPAATDDRHIVVNMPNEGYYKLDKKAEWTI